MNVLLLAEDRFGGQPKPDVEQFRSLWNDAMAEVADVYEEGTAEFIKENHSDLRADLDEAWDRANEAWGSDIDAFKAAIERWKALQLQAVATYQEHRRDTSL